MALRIRTTSGWAPLGGNVVRPVSGGRVGGLIGEAPFIVDMAGVTNASYLFANVNGFSSVRIRNMAGVTSTTYMFQGFTTLQTVDGLNTATTTDHSYMFRDLPALKSASLDISVSTSTRDTFYAATALETVSLVGAGASNPIRTNMFYECNSLRSVSTTAPIDVSSGNAMFYRCYNLLIAPPIRLVGTKSAFNMFNSCTSLTEIPPSDFTGVSNMGGVFAGCTSLTRIRITGIGLSFSIADCKLQANELNELFSGLVAGTSRTVTITGNPGAAFCDKTIATSKGWTVTG